MKSHLQLRTPLHKNKNETLYHTVSKNIFLTVLFDTLNNNVSFLFLFIKMCRPIVYLYYCYCTFINLYVGFQYFMYVFSYE